ncbi:hypothetical protein B296_00044622 [Ensete ventricosum]|uniref:Uncharacterized protein n=1 Tax=Ensete ventricosum TaxID=4639 RepID=A0A426YS13_ENSVE|nr:hypothetical protein B296_00044622 [Ensete ventricosum]
MGGDDAQAAMVHERRRRTGEDRARAIDKMLYLQVLDTRGRLLTALGYGARAYIVGVVDHPYLATRLPLWLTLSSYASTTPVVLVVRDASTGQSYDRWGIGLTCVRSIVRPLGIRPYLCQVGRTTTGAPILVFDQLPVLGRPRRRASCPKER